jgi:Kef-type K+ transport system membrane component KefB
LNTTETLLAALLVVFTLPWLAWRLGRTERWAPLVVVQIVTGILLGPGLLGAAFPHLYAILFPNPVVQALNGIAWWAVILFVFLAGLELDLKSAWRDRLHSGTAAALALGAPLVGGALAGAWLWQAGGWAGPAAARWQFLAGIGMACAVTALPILVLFLERLALLRQPLGQRILRYASLDDLAVWAVLALILADWARLSKQAAFLVGFIALASFVRRQLPRLAEADRWYAALVWLITCALAADWAGLHFMVGAFLAGAALEQDWLPQAEAVRRHVLLLLMPVFFLSTGLRTEWGLGGEAVFMAAAMLLLAAVGGKLAGTLVAGRLLGWPRHESWLIGWLLQTKALIMIIFANVLLDRALISADTFTALVLMAVASTMLAIPMAQRHLGKAGAPR